MKMTAAAAAPRSTSNGLQASCDHSNPPQVRNTVCNLMALPLVPLLQLNQAIQSVVATTPLFRVWTA
jgi:hypothetical protein